MLTVALAVPIGEASQKTPPSGLNLSCLLSSETVGKGLGFYGNTSIFFAYEQVGADLAKRSLATESHAQTVPVGVIGAHINFNDVVAPESATFRKRLAQGELRYLDRQPDEDPDQHDTHVVNVFAGRSPFGVAGKAELSFVGRQEQPSPSNLVETLEEFPKKSAPKIIAMSASPDSLIATDSLGPISKKSILVESAGNGYARRDYSSDWGLTPNKAQGRSIKVGAILTNGMLADYSSSGEEVTILAPGEAVAVPSANPKKYGPILGFAGTSSATPMVAGALANVVSILGDLTTEEAKILLKNTALPHLTSEQIPPHNGAGVLNAYKLVEVAKRLKSRGWRHLSPEQRSAALSEPPLYLFQTSGDLEQGIGLLRSGRCAQVQKGFELVRKSFFLASEPEFHQSAAELATVYRLIGLTGNAEFFEHFDRARLVADLTKNANRPDRENAISTARMALALGPEGEPIVQQLLHSSSSSAREGASYALALETRWMPETRALPLLQELLKRPLHDSANQAFLSAMKFGAAGEALVKAHAKDPDPEIRAAVAFALRRGSPEFAIPLLQELANDPSDEVKRQVAASAGERGAAGLGILNSLAPGASRSVWRGIADGASAQGEAAFDLLRQAVGKEDPAAAIPPLESALQFPDSQKALTLVRDRIRQGAQKSEINLAVFDVLLSLHRKNVRLTGMDSAAVKVIEEYVGSNHPGPYIQAEAAVMIREIRSNSLSVDSSPSRDGPSVSPAR